VKYLPNTYLNGGYWPGEGKQALPIIVIVELASDQYNAVMLPKHFNSWGQKWWRW